MRIRVNCVLPGIFPSEMTTSDKSSSKSSLNHFATAAAKRCTAGKLLFLLKSQARGRNEQLILIFLTPGRAGLPEEIVGPCLMLSSKAGGYMNGGYVMVDGGRAMVGLLSSNK